MTPMVFAKGLADSGYWGDKFFGRVVSEDMEVGAGFLRKAWRARTIYGLEPVFESGRTCILKVHNLIVFGTKNENTLIEKNYDITIQVGPGPPAGMPRPRPLPPCSRQAGPGLAPSLHAPGRRAPALPPPSMLPAGGSRPHPLVPAVWGQPENPDLAQCFDCCCLHCTHTLYFVCPSPHLAHCSCPACSPHPCPPGLLPTCYPAQCHSSAPPCTRQPVQPWPHSSSLLPLSLICLSSCTSQCLEQPPPAWAPAPGLLAPLASYPLTSAFLPLPASPELSLVLPAQPQTASCLLLCSWASCCHTSPEGQGPAPIVCSMAVQCSYPSCLLSPTLRDGEALVV
ncbi:hypothetical protein KIL84_014754 [Mauremys mutica]|uniref:Uncharacterized protein n=1 Tax=Mauremys mutica TaxID=74926 RepID=A0A9D4B7H8_9SAUR|nr:hypothetical protein KIL84_014754 [Mauremys mutica]